MIFWLLLDPKWDWIISRGFHVAVLMNVHYLGYFVYFLDTTHLLVTTVIEKHSKVLCITVQETTAVFQIASQFGKLHHFIKNQVCDL